MLAASVVVLAIAADIDRAFERMYSFDFRGAHAALERAIRTAPEDPLPYSVRAAAELFEELDRLGILQAELFATDKRLFSKRRTKPDPAARSRMSADLERARRLAETRLKEDPEDPGALFAASIAWGIDADYAALVEKRYIGILAPARKSQHYALRLLKVRPDFHDVRVTTGMSEYLAGSVPFFLRWLLRFEEVKGDKDLARVHLRQAAESGRYFGPFAKILLSIFHLREKRDRQAYALLHSLSQEFPENPLFRREAARLAEKLR